LNDPDFDATTSLIVTSRAPVSHTINGHDHLRARERQD